MTRYYIKGYRVRHFLDRVLLNTQGDGVQLTPDEIDGLVKDLLCAKRGSHDYADMLKQRGER